MDHLGETYPPCPACEFPNSLLEPYHRFRRETPLRWLVIREAEPQEFPFPWSSHRTLLAVHSQLKLRREESRHHPYSPPGRPDDTGFSPACGLLRRGAYSLLPLPPLGVRSGLHCLRSYYALC